MIDTERLSLYPLTFSQLKLRVQEQDELAKELNISFVSPKINTEEAEAIEKSFLPALAEGLKDYLFYTMWLILRKEDRVVIGGICFHGSPDVSGEVEIGYGLESQFQKKGYMKETILAMLDWLRERDDVKSVIAETDPANIPSVSLLENCGFSFYENKDENVIYKKILK